MVLADLKPFSAVYFATFVAMLFDILLISMMPQGFHLTSQMAMALTFGFILTCGGAYIALLGYIRLALAALAFASVYSIGPFSELAHLAPSYLGRQHQLADATLSSIDTTLGFNWRAYFAWHTTHEDFGAACHLAYLAWPLVALTIIAILALAGDGVRLAKLIVATNFSLTIVYLLAIYVPSYRAYTFYHINPSDNAGFNVQFSDYKPTYDALRGGFVNIYSSQIPSGAISFPSFHMTTVILYCWSIWPSRSAWMIVPIQILSFLAIPVQGAHFLTDMIVGALIGWIGILVADAAVRQCVGYIDRTILVDKFKCLRPISLVLQRHSEPI